MVDCFSCGKDFEESEEFVRKTEDYTLDENLDEIPIILAFYVCPYCGNFMFAWEEYKED